MNSHNLQQTSGEDDAVLDFMGHPTGVCGKTNLILSLGGEEWTGIECLVVKSGISILILGYDAVKTLGCKIQPSKETPVKQKL